MVEIKHLYNLKNKMPVCLYLLDCGHFIKKRKDQRHIDICRQCMFEKSVEDARRANLFLVCYVDKNSAKYQCLLTGEVSIRNRLGVREGRKLRHSKYKNRGIVYLVKITTSGFSWLKLGVTNRSQLTRFKQYGLSKNTTFESVAFHITFNSKLAYEIETKIKSKISQFNFHNSLMKNGYSECYYLDNMSEILSIFNKETLNE